MADRTVGLLYAALARRLVAVTVRGASMEPSYHDADRVLVRRDVAPVPGQVVVVERPAAGAGWRLPPLRRRGSAAEVAGRQWLIKRVAAAPGDPVPRDRVPALAAVPGDHVPHGSLVLLGDNQDVSFDSRRVGYFPADRVLGTVLRRLPPANGAGTGPGARPYG
ncbi:S26 family signal peptidase [Streptomyces sp. A3M-1-3]|uniref:S26 family signal peptidase n=1 Tax=Streptomyces sp. A3M-1-3 TaxID=2962044 RepID=UPI0020B69A11|nr:S26 family signal peptidase [Streptomyces sp. A3M-1-3]MCP3819731.1 S26 family signal peptidase [Streptomyces sp. A3M-1-3]